VRVGVTVIVGVGVNVGVGVGVTPDVSCTHCAAIAAPVAVIVPDAATFNCQHPSLRTGIAVLAQVQLFVAEAIVQSVAVSV